MLRPLRIVLALGAFFVLAAVMYGCGGGVPGDSVARIDDATIKKATFAHWLAIAARSSQPPGSSATVSVPDPPKFTKCIAGKRQSAPKPTPGQPKPTDAQFKAQCKQEYEGLRDQVMQFLVSADWIQGEANDLGIKLTDAEVQKQFQKQKKQSFPKEADFQKFLKSSGMTLQDILFRVRLDTLSNKIRAKVTKGKSKVTDAQIAAYYKKNKSRFSQPERRDLQVVLTKSKAKAAQARAEIAGGTPWKTVAKKLSIDQASKSQGGKLPGVVKGQQEKALDTAVFAAQKGKLEGPIKTQFGYYVFRVTKVSAASQQSLAQVTKTIKQLLASQNQQKALDSFVKDFQKKWKGRTKCAKDYVIQSCSNAPKPKTSSTATPPGAVPQQGAPQGAPPQGAPQGAPPQGTPQGAPPPSQGAPPPTSGQP